jgi:hypothetical protein
MKPSITKSALASVDNGYSDIHNSQELNPREHMTDLNASWDLQEGTCKNVLYVVVVLPWKEIFHGSLLNKASVEREREKNLRNLNTVCVGDLKSLYMHLLVKSRYAAAILDWHGRINGIGPGVTTESSPNAAGSSSCAKKSRKFAEAQYSILHALQIQQSWIWTPLLKVSFSNPNWASLASWGGRDLSRTTFGPNKPWMNSNLF